MANLLDNSNTEEHFEELETNVDQIEPRSKIEQYTTDANECLDKDTTVVEVHSGSEVLPAANLTQVLIHHQGSNKLDENEDITEVTFCFG